MTFRKIWWGSWWRLAELCEVPRCLLWRGLRHHCPVYNVSCTYFNICLYFFIVHDWIHETLYTGQCHLSPLQSRHLGTSHSSASLHQLPRHIFLSLIDSLKSLPFQRWFQFWEKPEVTGHQICAVGGLSHLGDLMFHQQLCTRRDAWAGSLS